MSLKVPLKVPTPPTASVNVPFTGNERALRDAGAAHAAELMTIAKMVTSKTDFFNMFFLRTFNVALADSAVIESKGDLFFATPAKVSTCRKKVCGPDPKSYTKVDEVGARCALSRV